MNILSHCSIHQPVCQAIGFSVSRLLQECRHDYHDNCIIYYDHNCDDISLLQNFVHHTKVVYNFILILRQVVS